MFRRTLSPKKQRPAAPYRRQDPWAPRPRGGGGGILLVGVLCGVAAGYFLTDPAAWDKARRAAGLPVAERPGFEGRPARITDGDTFRLGSRRVRLHGVDAPELVTADGPPAREHLAELIAKSRGPVRCEDTGQRSYERVVARCFTADGRDLSALMAEDGWATAMIRFSGWAYLPAQLRAMYDRRGMWLHLWDIKT